jgi:RNA polymerase sigma-B factor
MHDELWQQYREDRSTRNRNRLVVANVRLVHNCNHHYFFNHPWSEDLFQVGSIGLIKAIERFDSSRGVPFGCFATQQIWSEISHFLRDKRHIIKVSRGKQPYCQCSLNTSIAKIDGSWEEWIDVLVADPDRSTGEFSLSAEMLTEIGRLPDKQRQAIDLYYFQGLSGKQVAERMGVSTGSVSRYLIRGLASLRGSLSAA